MELRDDKGHTALHLAATHPGDIDIMHLLLDRAPDIHARDLENRTPLYLAAIQGSCRTVEILLENGATIEARAKGNKTPLHIATMHDRLDILNTLLQSGANPEAPTVDDKSTALHIAIELKYHECIMKLLAFGAGVETENSLRRNEIHLAALEPCSLILDVLLAQSHVRLDREDVFDHTALYCAVCANEISSVRQLAGHLQQSDISQIIKTPIRVAGFKGHVDAALVLFHRCREL
jgi:ankyrin repeat protein